MYLTLGIPEGTPTRCPRGHRRGLRRLAALVPVLFACTLLVACGDDDDAGAGESSGQFPVTVQHKFGSTTITEEPGRVVSVGYQEQDSLLALGIEPVAVRYWFGDENDVIFPWAEDEAGPDYQPEILNMADGINFEAVAALDPDLIVGIYSGMTDKDYELLSKIAPTIAQTDQFIDYGTPWDVQIRAIGQATGRSDRAEQVVADVNAGFERVKAAHPQWAGKTALIATHGESGEFGAFATEDPRSRILGKLGFTVPPAIDEAAGDQFYAEISRERTDLLNSDLLVWDQLSYLPGGRGVIEADPVLSNLAAMKEGRTIFMPNDVEFGFAFASPLSLPFVLDALVPELERAVR